jgi:hypothetical protein
MEDWNMDDWIEIYATKCGGGGLAPMHAFT